VGWIAVSAEPDRRAIRARMSPSLAPRLMDVVARLRALFDLDARPDLIAQHLGGDPALKRLVTARPGLRVSGAFDSFELAVRAVLGQQVSVGAATTLCGRLVHRFGREVADQPEGLTHIFPAATSLASAPPADIQHVGLPAARARSIVELARAIAGRQIDLSCGADPDLAIRALQELPGIGAWTAHYIVMRTLKWPDAFPAGDLAIRKALGTTTVRQTEARAEGWRPWRAYAVIHLWQALAQGD